MKKLIDKYRQSGLSADEFLYNYFGDKRGGIDFVDACRKSLKMNDRDLVWWCGMVDHYHHHEDMTVDSLLKTTKHFKNVSLSFLNKQEYKDFKTWNSNWSDMMIVCNSLDTDRWV